MRKEVSRLKRLTIPMVTIGIVLALLLAYFFVYVPAQREFFAKRDLRILNVMSNQIKARIENFTNVLHHIAADSYTEGEADQIKQRIEDNISLVPGLQLGEGTGVEIETPENHEHIVEHEQASEKIFLYSELAANRYILHFLLQGEFPRDHAGKEEIVKIKLDATRNLNELIEPIVNRDEFDNILLVKLRGAFLREQHLGLDLESHDGNAAPDENAVTTALEEADERNGVVFQRDDSELRIIKFDSLATEKDKTFLFDSIVRSSNIKDIVLVDTRYRLFLQPFVISLETGEIESEQPPERWVVVGLVQTDRFNSESRAISNHFIVFFSFLILIGILSLPIVKMKFMGTKDRLKIVDLVLLGYSFLLGAALITITSLNLYAYLAMRIRMDDHLEGLASQIETNFQAEIDSACAQLRHFNDELLNPELTDGHTHAIREGNIFLTGKIGQKDPYSFFEMVFWTDADGQQKVKWSVREKTTPFVSVATRAYFKNALHGSLWSFRQNPSDRAQGGFTLEPVYSSTTGENEADISVPFDTLIQIDGKTIALKVASLSTHLTSVIDPIIPAGYGFCIISQDGQVKFHSDESRNLQENLFAECDNSASLRAAVLGRANNLLDVKYMGRDHRLFVTPMKTVPWTLVVFRDKEVFRTINLELITMSMGLFIAYLTLVSGLGLCLWFVSYLAGKKSMHAAVWLWPSYDKRSAYLFLGGLLALINLVFAVGILNSSVRETVYLTLLFPAGGMALVYLLLRRPLVFDPAKLPEFLTRFWKPEGRIASSAYDTRYVVVMFLAVVLLGVLPAVGFFKIAHKMEVELFVKHGQLKLAEALEAREHRVSADYAKIKMDRRDKQHFLGKRLSFDSPDVYASKFFNTTIDTGRCGVKVVPANHEFENIFADLTMLYNQTTIEIRELIHDVSGDSRIRWQHGAGGRLTLHWNSYYNNRCLHIASFLPPFLTRFSSGPLWWPVFQILLILFFVVAVVSLFQLVRSIVRKLFLTDISLFESGQFEMVSDSTLANMLLVNPPEKVKAKLLTRKDVYRLDLIDVAVAAGWSHDYAYSDLPEGKVVVLDHFEHRMNDGPTNQEKREFLEQLVFTHRKKVVVISNVEPTHFLSDGEASEQASGNSKGSLAAVHGSTSVLDMFQRFVTLDEGDAKTFCGELASARDESLKLWPKSRRKHILNLCQVLYEECSPTAELQAIGRELLCKGNLVLFNADQLIDLVLEEAYAYYRQIWLSLSREEKLALIYLAQDGFANLTNRRVMLNLLNSKLVVQQPEFRIMNQSFRKFVLDEQDSDQVVTWARSVSTSYWSKLKMPLAIGFAAVVLFLFSTQPTAFRSTLTIISAVAGGIPALIKLLGSVKLGKAGAVSES
ncbi:MAG: cache domain-containing protein [bacterium]